MPSQFEKQPLVPSEDTKAKFDRIRRGLNDTSIVEEANLAIVPDEAIKAGIKTVVRGAEKTTKIVEPNTGMGAMAGWEEEKENREDKERENLRKAA